MRALADGLDEGFDRAVEAMKATSATSCRVVVTGIGKSGIVGQKIAATLASTGTAAFSLHPSEAIHGDLGMILKGDVVLALSHSGETEEIVALIPHVKTAGRDARRHDGPARLDARQGARTSSSPSSSARKPARSTSRPPPPRRPSSSWAMRSRWRSPSRRASSPRTSPRSIRAASSASASSGSRTSCTSGDEIPLVAAADGHEGRRLRDVAEALRHHGRRGRGRQARGRRLGRRPAPPARARRAEDHGRLGGGRDGPDAEDDRQGRVRRRGAPAHGGAKDHLPLRHRPDGRPEGIVHLHDLWGMESI